MSTLVIQLKKNLRRQILRGHPWVFRQALMEAPDVPGAPLVKVHDHQNEFLGWAIYDSSSPITLRILTTDKEFNEQVLHKKLSRAFAIRHPFPTDLTNAYRLINGEGDFLPGLVCDVYGPSAVIQYDGEGPSEFWQRFSLVKAIVEAAKVESVFIKSRGKLESLRLLVGKSTDATPVIKENSLYFKVDIEFGQKTGFFLDQRDNRKYITNHIKDRSVLNLFSYTGGFSIYAGRGGASRVVSVDISEKAAAIAKENWTLNRLPEDRHEFLVEDVFNYLTHHQEKFDCVIVDPPSMAPSEAAKEGAAKKYTELFTAAATRVNAGGDLYLSSCSSHINFAELSGIIEEAIGGARRRAQVLKIAGQGFDHPFPLVCPELRYLKFFHLKLN